MSDEKQWGALLVENTSDLVYMHRVAAPRGLVYVNRAAVALTGYAPEELCADPALGLGRVHPDADRLLDAALAPSAAPDGPITLAGKRKDGRLIWLEHRLTPISDGTGALVAIAGIARDVTEYRQIENALRQSEAELHARIRLQAAIARLGQEALADADLPALLDHAVGIVAGSLQVDCCGVFELLPNDDRLRLRVGLGWREGAVGSATVSALPDSQPGCALATRGFVLFADRHAETQFRDWTLLDEHGVVSGVAVVTPGKDRPFGVLAAYSKQRREFTRGDVDFLFAISGILGRTAVREQAAVEQAEIVARERTARAEAEAARQRAQALYEATHHLNESLDLQRVLSSVLDAARRLLAADRGAIWHEDRSGVYICPASFGLSAGYVETVCRRFRASPLAGQVIVTRSSVQVEDVPAIPPSSKQAAAIARAAADEGVRACLVLPLLWQGAVSGVLSIYHDQPRRFSDEETQLAQTLANHAAIAIGNARLFAEVGELEALVELDRLKSEFIATVSHELRTPLSLVYGYAELLRLRDLADPRAQLMADGIYQGAAELVLLVDHVIDFSLVERGELKLKLGELDLEPLLAEAVEGVASSTGRRLCSDMPRERLVVRGDADRLRQVVVHLLSNAARYSPKDAPIALRAAVVDREIQVSVADEGIGLSPAQLERVFEKFYRGQSALMHEQPGMGLGLAISRYIVEAHGGRIWAESPGLGLGATFHFTVPVASGQ